MIGTLISILIATLITFYPLNAEIQMNSETMVAVFISIAILFIFLSTLSHIMAWAPLQKAEKNLTPHLIELYRQDHHIRFCHIWLFLFSLISFVLAMKGPFNTLTFSIWLILVGISFDTFTHSLMRMLKYLNPFSLVEQISRAGKISIMKEKEGDLCNWIDALCEIAVKAVQKGGFALCNKSVNESQMIIRNFLESSKSISHRDQDEQSKAMGISDKISYTLFYLFQRLELINNKALEQKFEPICSNLITALGKIAVNGAKCDLSITSYPLHFLTRFTLKAQEMDLSDMGLKSTLTLMEVAKTILKEVDYTYGDLKDPFFSIIMNLDAIAKETFRKNKETNIKLLMQPFQELKELFSSEKLAGHRDTSTILQSINNILSEFETLETVMKTIPPLSEMLHEQPTTPPPDAGKL